MWDSNWKKISHVHPAHLHNQLLPLMWKIPFSIRFYAPTTWFWGLKVLSTFCLRDWRVINENLLQNNAKLTWFMSFFFCITQRLFSVARRAKYFQLHQHMPCGCVFLKLSCVFSVFSLRRTTWNYVKSRKRDSGSVAKKGGEMSWHALFPSLLSSSPRRERNRSSKFFIWITLEREFSNFPFRAYF